MLCFHLMLFHQMYKHTALAGVAQWIECQRANQKVTGSIPNLGHMPGLQATSPGHEMQPHTDISLPLFLPPFPSL